MDRLFLPVLLGTNRQKRNSVFPARWLVGQMEKRADIETRLFDVRDFALPQDDYGQGIKDPFSRVARRNHTGGWIGNSFA